MDDDGADAELLATRAECLDVLRVVVRELPHPRALDEELHGLGADLRGVVEGLLHPAGAVSAG